MLAIQVLVERRRFRKADISRAPFEFAFWWRPLLETMFKFMMRPVFLVDSLRKRGWLTKCTTWLSAQWDDIEEWWKRNCGNPYGSCETTMGPRIATLQSQRTGSFHFISDFGWRKELGNDFNTLLQVITTATAAIVQKETAAIVVEELRTVHGRNSSSTTTSYRTNNNL